MSGCAGGLSGGLWAYGATLRPGAEFILDALGFDARLADADAVVSGEGRFDHQSFEGKVVGAVAARCAAAGKPLHLVVGEEAFAGPLPAGISSLAAGGELGRMEAAGGELAKLRP